MRFGAAPTTLGLQRFQGVDSLVVVFARHRSVDLFCRLNTKYSALNLSIDGGVMPTRLAITSDELRNVRLAGNVVVAWAGAREQGIDFHRALLANRPAMAQLQIIDLQDNPHDRSQRSSELTRTIGSWNRSRQRFYSGIAAND